MPRVPCTGPGCPICKAAEKDEALRAKALLQMRDELTGKTIVLSASASERVSEFLKRSKDAAIIDKG